MRRIRLLGFALSLILTSLAIAPTAQAATPKDALVMAWQIDDILSLDPAEIFEFSTSELAGNTYDRLIGYDYKDVSKIHGVIAESWTISPDSKTYTFKIRPGLKFASGNPITAEDVAFSLQRAVILDKSPAFIINQFGFTAANVKDKIKAIDPMIFTFEVDKPYAQTFVLYCLTATVASVVDKTLTLSHEVDGDLGYGWLKKNYAGSGPFAIKDWRPNEVVTLERNENYAGTKPPMKRIIYRHVPEAATQRLLLEKGDVDIARNLSGDDIDAVEKSADIQIIQGVKGTVYYISLNQSVPELAKPKVREAFRYLIDYDAIAASVAKRQYAVHQAFLPIGFLGALSDTPFKLDIAKAKALLAEAGYPDGFKVTMDTRNVPLTMGIAEAIQSSLAKGGIKLEIIPGDYKQVLTKYRARTHQIYIGDWGADYQDPNSNAETFASNLDNSDQTRSKTLAWRNSWAIPELSAQTASALTEQDSAKRAAIYGDLQRQIMADSPFIVMFQKTEVAAARKNVKDFIIGPSFDTNSVATTSKN